MKIAVEGCAHGELDKIYETIAVLEKRNKFKVDLLIICGDFQSVRNPGDLESMAVPPKYRSMNTFYKYYSGEKIAPILTIFIGGNHEASNYLSELAYGGWVCPNIFYMGHANVINVGGVRIAGLSGIYKAKDYMRGHFERPPYEESSKRSVYHVRNLDVFRLKQIKGPIDICVSHDWPKRVYKYGSEHTLQQLFRRKPFFKEEMENSTLGSDPAEELLHYLKPSYWFAAHLHCKFSVLVPHSDKERPSTKFLALDKCLPRRSFLQILDIGKECNGVKIEYDPEWLSVLHNTNHLLSVSNRNNYLPTSSSSSERFNFTPTAAELQQIQELFNYNFEVPENFSITAPTYHPKQSNISYKMEPGLNPQTQTFCKKLNLRDPFAEILNKFGNSLNISDFSCTDTDMSYSSVMSVDQSELSSSDAESSSSPKDSDIPESGDFFIDTAGSGNSDCKPSSVHDDLFFFDTVGSR